MGQPTEGAPFTGSLATLWAILLTAGIATVWPLVLVHLGWRLADTQPSHALIEAVAAGIISMAGMLWALELVRHVFRQQGLAHRHLGWDSLNAQIARSTMLGLIQIGLPIVLVVTLLERYQEGRYEDSLGRLAFMLGLLVLAAMLHRVFGSAQGLFRSLIAAYPEGWLYRARHFVWGLAVGIPIVLTVISALGYNYTAHQLGERLLQTLCLAFAVQFVRSLIARWLFIKQWNLARSLAEQRVAESEGTAEGSAQPETQTGVDQAPGENVAVQEAQQAVRQLEEETLVTIDLQLQQLLRIGAFAVVAVGTWLIWSDMIPALRALDRIVVWQATESTALAPSETPSLVTPARLPDVTGDLPAETRPPLQGASLGDVLLTLLIAVVTVLAGKNIPGLLNVFLLERLPLDSGARNAVTTLCGYAIMLTGLVLGCNALGLRWHNVQWLAAALMVGLGFGLQEIFANFISGLILLFERPIRVGDVITLGDTTGTVSRIRIRATTITNWDRKELVVPNKDLITGRLLNWTLTDRTNRLVLNVGVAYGSDLEKVRKVLDQIIRKHPNVLDDPAPLITFETFGDSTLNFSIRCYLSSLSTRLATTHELNCAIHDRFAEAGIEIAFPQRDIHMRSNASQASHPESPRDAHTS
jgi:potassium efflux system protein